MNKIPIDISKWGLHRIELHPLVHDYFQGVYADELVEWFARHGFAINKTWAINPGNPDQNDGFDRLIVHVPEELVLEFKLRWAK